MDIIFGVFAVVVLMLSGAFLVSGYVKTATYIAVGDMIGLMLFSVFYDTSSPTSSLTPIIFDVGLIAFIVIAIIQTRKRNDKDSSNGY